MTAPTQPAAGRVSRQVQSLAPSGIRRFFDLIASTPGVISLGVGEPDFRTPQVVCDAATRHIQGGGSLAYSSNKGTPAARQAVSAHFDRLYGAKYDPETEILITVGSSQAIDMAFRAILDPGDEAVVIEPCYVAYAPMVLLAGGKPNIVATRVENNYHPDPDDIAKAITPKTKAILLGYPNNPTGATYPKDLLLKIAALAEKHNLLVVSDELYAELTFDQEHVCFPMLPGMRDRTILISGVSKSHAMTGWRVGYVCAPPDILAGILKIHQYSMLCAPTVSQVALVDALEKGAPEVAKMRAAYERRRHVVAKTFNDAGLHCPLPEGAFYAFADIRATGVDDSTLCERLLAEEKVAIVPGRGFGDSGKGFVRVCFPVDDDRLAEAMGRLSGFLYRL
jgi:aminotransferase